MSYHSTIKKCFYDCEIIIIKNKHYSWQKLPSPSLESWLNPLINSSVPNRLSCETGAISYSMKKWLHFLGNSNNLGNNLGNSARSFQSRNSVTHFKHLGWKLGRISLNPGFFPSYLSLYSILYLCYPIKLVLSSPWDKPWAWFTSCARAQIAC